MTYNLPTTGNTTRFSRNTGETSPDHGRTTEHTTKRTATDIHWMILLQSQKGNVE